MEDYQLLIIFLLFVLILLAVLLFKYFQKLNHQLVTQKQNNKELRNTQKQLFTILEQETRKPILAFRNISEKIDFLIDHNESNTLRQFGHQLDSDAKELNLFLENLFNWAKSHNGGLKYDPQPIPIKLLLENINDKFVPLAKQYSVTLTTEFDEAGHISADLDTLFLILKNIIYQIIKLSTNQEDLKIDISKLNKQVDIQFTSKAVPLNLLENNPTCLPTFDVGFIKRLIHLNRGSLELYVSPKAQIPTIRCSFPRA